MMLTITYKGENAADLGFLLFKNPARPQGFDLSFGKAYVFYPEVASNTCTAALLLDIDPLDLARGKIDSKEGGLFDYVNDRPYVSSSFMSTAISHVFGTSLSGRCDKKPDLVKTPLDLTASITMLPCKSDKTMLNRVFEPLGYSVTYDSAVLDENYPQWGEGRYVNLTISGKVRLQSLLRHLYVLIPVFDRKKHYWIGPAEVEKLLRHGGGWLEEHPEKNFITERYMGGRRGLARMALKELALDRLDDGQAGTSMLEDSSEEEVVPKPPTLNARRLAAVLQELKSAGASSVIDVGCGEGNLLSLLLKDYSFTRITGVDVSTAVLERAVSKLKLDRLPEARKAQIQLFQSSLTYKDERFFGYDAACVVEVVEHLDESRLDAFEQVLFADARPRCIVLTTPNIEYNENYASLEGKLRHGDHRFEWTRKQFKDWAESVAARHGYTVQIKEVGDEDETSGTPTQMGVFTLCE